MPKKTQPPKPSDGIQIREGRSYVFFRDGHAFHGASVSVVGKKGNRWRVALTDEVAKAILSPRYSKKRKLKTWFCTDAELW